MPDQTQIIRPMSPADLDFALRLVTNESWGMTRLELERLLGFEPRGCFVAECQGERTGIVMSTSYGALAWIGNLMVEPARRGHGTGAALMRQAIEYLQKSGVETIRLDAEQKAVPLYQRLGFVEEGRSLRFQTPGLHFALENVDPMDASDLDAVLELDLAIFGADRSRVIRRAFEDVPGLAFVARAYGDVLGFIMARPAAIGGRIGPWICRPDELSQRRAKFLLRAVLNEFHRAPVSVGVLDNSSAGIDALRHHGFRETPWSARMRLGPDAHRSDPQGELAIGSPPKG